VFAATSTRAIAIRMLIALDAETIDALREHRDVQLAERDFALDAYEDQDLVFADELADRSTRSG
jgi:hypothetical protein